MANSHIFEDIRLDETQDSGAEIEPPEFPADEKTYTIEQAVEAFGLGWFQALIISICGILQAANAMEMLLLSVLGPVLRCAWHLDSKEVALITTVVFVGFFFGAPLWGLFSDKYGRKSCFLVVLIWVSYTGLATALSPNFAWLVSLRGLVGFGMGGEGSSYTLMSEFLPIKYRAKVLMAISVFWAIGSTLEIVLAYFILPSLGWRWLVLVSALPLAVFCLFLPWLPESVHYLMTANRLREAERIVKRMAVMNRCVPLEGELAWSSPAPTEVERGKLSHLWAPEYRVVSMIQPFIWFASAFCYYGVILISSTLFSVKSSCYAEKTPHPVYHGDVGNKPPVVDQTCCQAFTNDDYTSMLVSSLGEFAVIPLVMVTNDCLGRRPSLAILAGVSACLFMLLLLCMPKGMTIAILFVMRALTSGLLSTAYLYTTEVYPTTVRSLGQGICSAFGRLGAMSTPYVASVIMPDVSPLAGLSIYGIVSLLCALFAALLPIETKDRMLQEVSRGLVLELAKRPTTRPAKASARSSPLPASDEVHAHLPASSFIHV